MHRAAFLVCLAILAAALGCSFYFRGTGGDYNLLRITSPEAHANEYFPPDASRTLAFPQLPVWLAVWGVAVLGGWWALAGAMSRRGHLPHGRALQHAAVAFAPLLALLLIPAHHAVGLPLTIGPVFLLIFCVSLCVVIGHYLLAPRCEGGLIGSLSSTAGLWVLAAVYTIVLTAIMVIEYRALNLGYLDSGTFAEHVFHASRGESLRSNFQPDGTFLALHLTLMLEPIAWLWRVWPRHELLFVIQSAGMGVGCVAVGLLGRAVLKDRFAAWCLAVAYAVSPATLFVNLPTTHGFRELTLLVPPLLWAICFLERGRPFWLFFFLLIAFVAKEEAAPAVVMLGVFIAVRHRRWAVAAGTVAFGIAAFVLATKAMEPLITTGRPPFPQYFLRFGNSAPEVLGNVALDPLGWLGYIFGQPVKVFFLLHLLVPLLCLPLLSPSAALVGLASFAILAMATWYGKYIIVLGAQATVLPGFCLAAAYGLRNLAVDPPRLLRRVVPRKLLEEPGRLLRAAAFGVVAASVLSCGLFFLRTVPWRKYVVTQRHRTVDELRRLVPREATLCASYRLASHFCDQRELFVARDDPARPGAPEAPLTYADYVLLDLYDNFVDVATIARYRNAVLRSGRYGVVYAHDGFLLFQRRAKGLDLDGRYKLLEPPRPQQPMGRSVAGFATLLGCDVQPAPNGLALTLYWRCEAETAEDYAMVLALPTGPGGKRTTWRYCPCDGILPTWQWRRGDILVDRVVIPGVSPPPEGRAAIEDVAADPLGQ